jgi:hypothetical protein
VPRRPQATPPALKAWLFGILISLAVAAQTSKPFLRIETGTHIGQVPAIDTDAAARFLVTASHDKTARVWDLTNGNLLRILRPPQGDGNDGKLYAAAISPDGATIAVSGWIGTIYVFERASGRLGWSIRGLPNSVHYLGYSQDGRHLAATLGGQNNGLRIYRTTDYQEEFRDTNYGNDSSWAEFDRAGRLLTACDDGFVRLYGADFRLLIKLKAPGGGEPFSARFSPDAAKVAVGFSDSHTVSILSGRDLEPLYLANTTLTSKDDLGSVAWSSDGRLCAGGRYRDGSARYPILSWADAGRGHLTQWPAASSTVMSLQAASGGRIIFSSADGAFGVLDAKGSMLWQHTPDVLNLAKNTETLRISPDGGVVEFGFLVAFLQRTIRFSLASRQLAPDPASDPSLAPPRTTGLNIVNWRGSERPTLDGRNLTLDRYETSRSLAISRNADSFLLGTDWWLRFFDRQGQQKWTASAPGVAWVVNLTADGRYGVAALGDGTIRWYQLSDAREVLALFVPQDRRRWVAWTPEGFFDSSPGGEALFGYHLNQGPNREGEFVRAEQLFKLFYRPDVVARRLEPLGGVLALAARDKVGDISTVLAGGLPPDLELLSPSESQSDGAFVFRLRTKNRGGGVGRVVYRIDGVEIEGRPVDIPVPGSDTLERRFDLAPGRHEISAAVFNAANKVESRSLSSIVNVRGIEQRPVLYVVAVGVSDYRDHALAQGVKFAASDAETVAARLKEQGQGLFRDVKTNTLSNQNATRANIERTVAAVATQIQPSDVFVLYLAGHGTTLDGEYSFIPWEVRYTNQEALRQESLDQEGIRKLLTGIPARKTLLLLDTCGSGAFATGPGRALDEKGAIDKLSRITGRAVLAASASDQMALEGYQGHGVFTYALLEGLSKAASDNELIEVSRLADYIEDVVPKITKARWGYEQFPMRDLKGQTFPIARKPAH